MTIQKTVNSESRDLVSFYEKEALVAHRYDSSRFWESRYHNKKAQLIHKVLRTKLRKGNFVLDAGCGTGELSIMATQMGGYVISVDFSKAYLKRLPKTVGDRVCASLTHLPFKERVFEVVICADVVEHVYEYDRVVSELHSVSLKTLIVTAPCEGVFRIIYGKLFPKKIQLLDAKVGHVNIFPLADFAQKLDCENCQVSSRSYHVIQPIVDNIFPKGMDSIIKVLERFADLILPHYGTISLATVSSFTPDEEKTGALS